ncbi:MAG: hypothetical protein COU69_02155 [Candidatus Pacebacteria bacterium CG10_big_fil_rev_8_21_14_0_10_56_10]|nr:MAG: hypothetical protein COU69_02155 [Candidatus Pacebacteria bacterium CG10_big_fil_rev_8_21_14_0_10_56_10]
MSQDLTFTTAISRLGERGVEVRGVPLSDLVAEADFVKTLFFHLTGRQPVTGELKLLNAMLVAALDHGVQPASGFVPRVVASVGNDVLTAMAATLLALGPYHGGAVTGAMKAMIEIKHKGENVEAACRELVQEYRQAGRRVPGFGHPHYTQKDPRAQQLFHLAHDHDLPLEYINLATILETTLEHQLRRKLVLNIDGAIAALLLTIGIDPIAGNALFGLARVAGSIAHIVEEQTSDAGVRRLSDQAVTSG